jgi:hypothetical protein
METLESFFNKRAKQSNTAATSQTFTQMAIVRCRLGCRYFFSSYFFSCQTKLRYVLPNLFLFSANRQESLDSL